jgi:CARDB
MLQGRSPRLIGLLIGALALSAFTAPAGAKAHHPKPNLIIPATRTSGPDHGFEGDMVTFTFRDHTKNEGQAKARHSITDLELVAKHAGANAISVPVGSHSVPKLGPGDTARGGGSGTVDTHGLPLGEYELVICADDKNLINESRELDNCTETGDEFYLGKELWSGSLDGAGQLGGIPKGEKWNSGDSELVFDDYLGSGVFDYHYEGTVAWTDSGINPSGCEYSGGGSMAFDTTNSTSDIKLDYRRAKYKGKAEANDTFYTITIAEFNFCGGTIDGPVYPDFLNIEKAKPLEFDQRSLKGKSLEPDVTWHWTFD